MKLRCLVFLVVSASVAHSAIAAQDQQAMITTSVVPAASADTRTYEWGQLITYYSGETWSTRDSLTAVAVIHPGMQIHPPHVHLQEEYLMILEGEGTWTVKGEHIPARAGDVLYAAPWQEHGIVNTGDKPLRLLIFKWAPKPVEAMADPANGK